MHAAALGREIGVREIIVPRYPGYFSAWGMLATEPRRDFVRTQLRRAETMTADAVRGLFAELEGEARDYFRTDPGLPDESLRFERGIDLRYLGQEHWVTVPIGLELASIGRILADFHDAHERAYTFHLLDTPVEFVNFRLTATATVPRPRLEAIGGAHLSAERASKARREVDFGEDGSHRVQVYARDFLPPGFEAAGPLIIEEASSTTMVLPDQRLAVDDLGFLRIRQR
jgi:N-methylhydantoinase A